MLLNFPSFTLLSGVVTAPLDTPNPAPNSFLPAEKPVGSSCSSYSSFMNHSLDILDIGCGTGLVGAWLKDYAKTLVGVGKLAENIFLIQI